MGIVICLHLILIAALNIPYFQRQVSALTSQALSDYLHTKVSVQRIEIGFLNRMFIEGIHMDDQQQKTLLQIDKVSAKIELHSLLKGKIVINTVQLFSFQANLYKQTIQSPYNFQFVLDALASKDTTQTKKPLDLRINSLIIREGKLSYDLQYKPIQKKFDTNHLHINNLNAHISLKALQQDSLNARVRQISFQEGSGLNLKNLSLLVEANKHHCRITDFKLELPRSSVAIDSLIADYDTQGKQPFLESLKTKGSLRNARITLTDIKSIVPLFRNFNESLNLSVQFNQEGRFLTINKLSVHSRHNELDLACTSQILLPADSIDKPQIYARITHLDISPNGFPLIFNNLSLGETPSILTHIGQLHFKGDVETNGKYLYTNGNFETSIGNLYANGQLDKNGVITGKINSPTLHLGTLLANDKLGDVSLDVQVNGCIAKGAPTGKIDGAIHFIDYNNYRFQDIAINASYNGVGVEGHLSMNDPNCQFQIDGQAMLRQRIPSYNLTAQLNHFYPTAIGLDKKEVTYSGILNASCTGNSIDDLLGNIQLSDFRMKSADDSYQLKRLSITADKTEEGRNIVIDSDFLQAKVQGDYLYTTIPQSVMNVLNRYIPSLLPLSEKKHTPHNNFAFDLRLTDATPLQKLLNVPLDIEEPLHLTGRLDDVNNSLFLDIIAANFDYNGSHYEQGRLLCNNDDDEFKANIAVNKFNKSSVITLGVNATAKDNNLYTDIHWDNNHKTGSFRGTIATNTNFQKIPNTPLKIGVDIRPSNVIVNDTTWNIRPASIEIQGKDIDINHFTMERGTHHLKIDGAISENDNDSIYAELNDINLEYVFDALNFHPVDFTGYATGRVYASNLLHTPFVDTHLFVRDFHFEGGLLGNANIYGKWDKEKEGIYLNAYISEFASHANYNTSEDVWKAFDKQNNAIGLTHVEGIVSPVWNGLDLHIDADRTNLHFLEGFVGNIFEDIQGRGTGWCRVSGSFKNIDLTANLKAKAKAKVISLNTTYEMESDSIHLATNQMNFNDVTITDKDGHKGTVKGQVSHYYLHDLKYDFRINSDNLLCYDVKDFGDMPFYATAYGGGSVAITGRSGVLNVEADMETRPGTLLVYDASSPDEIVNTQFITFVDKTPKDETKQPVIAIENHEAESEPTNIYINMQVAATPDATIRVIMDKQSGDYVNCNGNGNIQAQYFNKGAFKMFGTYNITKGVYKMSMQEVIRKEFALQNGGTVTFNGNPYQAQLDVQAVYTVNSASLSDLSPNATFSQSNTVRVNCLMNLTGSLLKPSISFGLDLPSVSEEDREMVRSLVSTEEQMNMQIIYLLGIGRFYTADYTQDNTNQTNQAMNSILTSTLSGQFNQMLSQVINSSNWNFGANVSPGQNGLNDMEFQTILSGSLFNNRLLLNGNFGYRENVMTNSNFVGDFDLQWLLNKPGTISLKAYNETNDRYFTKNTLTTQGIGIIFKKDFERWSNLFRWKRRKEKTDTTRTTKNND